MTSADPKTLNRSSQDDPPPERGTWTEEVTSNPAGGVAGAAVGLAAGAVTGIAAGPVGSLAGAVVGAVTGGLAGAQALTGRAAPLGAASATPGDEPEGAAEARGPNVQGREPGPAGLDADAPEAMAPTGGARRPAGA